MLNEGQVALKWQRLFANQVVTTECLMQADELLEQLRPESPLRFRLEQELLEIRQLQEPEPARSKPAPRKRAPRKIKQSTRESAE